MTDVKIVLSEDKFNKLDKIKLCNIDNNISKECLICLECFSDNNEELIKINCDHLFHNNCIKNWLCCESNKCPICRIEVDEGIKLNY